MLETALETVWGVLGLFLRRRVVMAPVARKSPPGGCSSPVQHLWDGR